ncbi:MAG TPA: nucleotide exchange factor GrpE [Longimicrobiaceae bacterium]|nr:nucleotide exchange factor GrpE [Longimicrobiaceae bacterium]
MKKHDTADAPAETPTAPEQEADGQGQQGAQPGSDGPSAGAAASADASERELAAARDRHLRLAAEFDNYKKRVERERAEAWNRAQAQLAEKLLDVLDDLQRVAHYDPETATAQSLVEGAQMVERKLHRALESAGVEEVAAEGERFDPAAHEALMTVPTEVREEDDTVADVFQKGYRFKGTLLRPARVRVKRYEG